MIGFLIGVLPEIFGTGERLAIDVGKKELGGHDGKRRDGELLR